MYISIDNKSVQYRKFKKSQKRGSKEILRREREKRHFPDFQNNSAILSRFAYLKSNQFKIFPVTYVYIFCTSTHHNFFQV